MSDKRPLTIAELARRTGKHRKYLYQIFDGVRKGTFEPRCGMDLALQLQEASEGMYPATYFRPDLKDKAKKIIDTL